MPYVVMGGIAVRLHGLPRPTFDVDFTAAIARDALPELYQAAEVVGFTIPAAQLARLLASNVFGSTAKRVEAFVNQGEGAASRLALT